MPAGSSHESQPDGPAGVAATRVGRALVVTLPSELSDGTFRTLRGAVLDRLQARPTTDLIFECSGLEVIDASDFASLTALANAGRLLGVRPVVVGLRAGIVAYLVDAGVDTSSFTALRDLDDALAQQPGDDERH